MKKILIVLAVLATATGFSQADYETTGFRIDAVSKETPDYMKPLNAVTGVRTYKRSQAQTTAPKQQVVVSFSDKKAPDLITKEVSVTPIKKGKVYGFSQDGSISGVKNIAYKKSQTEGAHQLYCRSVAAGRGGGGR